MERRKFILAAALSIPAFGLAQHSDTKTRVIKEGFVVKNKESRFNEKTKLFGENPVDIKVSSKDTNDAFSISEYTGFTKGGPPLHIHPNIDEVFIILEGEHLFQLGNERHHLAAGDTIFIPRGVPHAPAQLSEKGKYIYFFSPSGSMEDFFRGLGEIKVTEQASPEQMAQLFKDHDMQIVGPPLEI